MNQKSFYYNLIKLHFFLIILILCLINFKSYAAGFFDGTNGVTSSTLVLPPTLTINSSAPIGTIVYTSPPLVTSMRDGATKSAPFLSSYSANPFSLSSYGNYVYDTNIRGLGFRLRGSFNTYYTSNINQYFGATGLNYQWYYSISLYYPQYAYLEFVKTSNDIYSGNLDLSGVVATLRYNPGSSTDVRTTWRINLSGQTAVTASSCQAAPKDYFIQFNTAYTSEFKAINSTNQKTNFDINLNCPTTTARPAITFLGTTDNDIPAVFKNTNGTALGVGLQISRQNVVISPNTRFSLANADIGQNQVSYQFSAALYQTKSNVTGGTFNTVLTFTLTYD